MLQETKGSASQLSQQELCNWIWPETETRKAIKIGNKNSKCCPNKNHIKE